MLKHAFAGVQHRQQLDVELSTRRPRLDRGVQPMLDQQSDEGADGGHARDSRPGPDLPGTGLSQAVVLVAAQLTLGGDQNVVDHPTQ